MQVTGCLLDNLLAARDEEGRGMTDLALRDELMTLLVAGQETCAFFLAVPSHICYLQPVSICESLTRSNLLAGQETCALFLAVPPHICHLQLLYFICGSLTRSKVIAGQETCALPHKGRHTDAIIC